MTSPICAMIKSSVTRVQCEATGKWLDGAYRTCIYSGQEKAEMLAKLKAVEYQFYRVKEEQGDLWVTSPAGMWLKDGRLVSTDYDQGERVAAYYGHESEITAKGRDIRWLKTSPW